MKQLVPVVFAVDDAFACCTSVAIASLIANCDPERQYAIYIFFDDLSEENQSRLCSMAVRNVTVECVSVTDRVDKELLYSRSRLPMATYFRFFAADVLPQYDKLLYLDGDIAILGDVGELYDTDIGDCWLGAVPDYWGGEGDRKKKEEYLVPLMGLTADRYFNAGVLVMNLRAFREQDLCGRCLNYLAEHRDLLWLDQDALNAVCRDHVCFLSNEWNTNQFWYEDNYEEGRDVSSAKLIHYQNRFKPWMVDFRCSHVFFYQYTLLSPYAQELTKIYQQCNRGTTTHNIERKKAREERAARVQAEKAAREAQRRAEAEARAAQRRQEAEERAARRREEAKAREAKRREEQHRLQEERRIAQQILVEKKAQALAKKIAPQQVLAMAAEGKLPARFLIKCAGRWVKGRVKRVLKREKQ